MTPSTKFDFMKRILCGRDERCKRFVILHCIFSRITRPRLRLRHGGR